MLLSFLAIQTGFGQTLFSIKAGANLATTTINKDYIIPANTKTEPKLGYILGLITQRNLNEKFYVRPELFLSVKGYKLNDAPRTTGSFYYVNLPVLFGYNLSPKVSFYLGPQVGVLGPVYFNDKNSKRSRNVKKANGYNTFDAGAGAGINYKLSAKASVDFRYNQGFTNVLFLNYIDHTGRQIEADVIKNNRTLDVSFNYFLWAGR